MVKPKRGRHAPAFILLSIAQGPNHGLGILNVMNEMVPNNRLDTAIIYRTLKDLEKEGHITSSWEDSGSGPRKKVYSITEEGYEKLDEYRKDIEKSLSNLMKFVEIHDNLSKV